MMKTIRCGRGLGDSLYLQSVVRHLVEKGNRLRVKSDFPDLFRHLPRVEVKPFDRRADIVAHYASSRGNTKTTQFQDCCQRAGITEPVELRLDWTATDEQFLPSLRDLPRPIVLVQLPRAPMARTDGFGMELLPDCRVIQRAINLLRSRCVIVQVGAGTPLFRFDGIDLDLANKTTVRQLVDVASIADGFLGYCSFLIPLAESLSKPALVVWSSRGLKSGHLLIRQITPKKIIEKPSTVAVIDNAAPEELERACDAFIR
jgi:hypothetical protein